MTFKDIPDVIKETFAEWGSDKAARLAAALAYYTIFSLAPLLIIITGIAGIWFGQATVQADILAQVEENLGQSAASLVKTMIQGGFDRNAGIAATIIGVITLVFGASGVFGQLQDALNTIFDVDPPAKQGILALIKKRLLAISMVMGMGAAMLTLLVISAVLAGFEAYFVEVIPGFASLLGPINFIISMAVVAALFAIIFKILPDAAIAWRDAWIGATVTALLFTIGKTLLGIYLGSAGVGSAYGAAGSLVVLLLWIYYSAQILLFGAEFTEIYARRFGSKVIPNHSDLAGK